MYFDYSDRVNENFEITAENTGGYPAPQTKNFIFILFTHIYLYTLCMIIWKHSTWNIGRNLTLLFANIKTSSTKLISSDYKMRLHIIIVIMVYDIKLFCVLS